MKIRSKKGFDWDELKVSLISSIPTIMIFAWAVGWTIWGLYLLFGPSNGFKKFGTLDNHIAYFGAVSLIIGISSFWVGFQTRRALRMRFTSKRVRLLWLRPFRLEGRGGFQTSRVIDRLPQSGILPLTLQDVDMRLSLEQIRHRRAGRFWFLVLLQILAILFLFYRYAPSEWWSFDGFIILLVLFILGPLLLLLFWFGPLFLLAAMEAGARLLPSLWRDDFRHLNRTLKRIQSGRWSAGAIVMRVRDEHWRETVTRSLVVADVILIDVTRLSENVLWELKQLDNLDPPPRLLFMCREDRREEEANLRQEIESVLRHPFDPFVFYPSRRGRDTTFAKALVAAIFNTVGQDLRKRE